METFRAGSDCRAVVVVIAVVVDVDVGLDPGPGVEVLITTALLELLIVVDVELLGTTGTSQQQNRDFIPSYAASSLTSHYTTIPCYTTLAEDLAPVNRHCSYN